MHEASAFDIVLIEDDVLDAELAQRALRAAKIAASVKVLHDGAEALDYFLGTGGSGRRKDTWRPKVILLDLKLPKVSGLELLEQLKADARTRTIPVVAMTSSSEVTDVARAYALGVNSYIVKPVEYERFVAAIAWICLYWLIVNEPPR